MTRAEQPEAKPSAVRIRNRYAGVVLAGCTVIALSGCSSDDKNDDARETTPAPSTPAAQKSTPSADPQAAAEEEVLDIYRRYWDDKAAAYSKASLKGSDMKTYVKGNALGQVQADVKNLKTLGQITRSKPTLDPEVASLDLKKKVPLAKISDCLDVSKWDLVDSKTKKKVVLPEDRRTKYVNNVTAEKWGKQWVILEVQPQDRAC
ncbi:hypothetical protein OG453_44655 [Streptomyces sp. NBC_01381]|uniref:hypothetical protein n=1 Tax=Streptomyces sp. NBC_01381 TaxID=2903845 RepID=UPI0022568CBD|nr:hypothetical protein [Streptomyces sp. NBC_01381]MCX4673651.1 hypothetical protein [Streptomyces sp. NBC_01381]